VTYDKLYKEIVNYIAVPHTDETSLKTKACLILGAFMEFIMDCDDAGIDVNKIDLTNFVGEKLNELGK
jgi:hypothetical protein